MTSPKSRAPELVEERVVVAGCELRLQRPADPERLLDEEAFDVDEFLPYWAELWPSGRALARFVAGLNLAGRTVLELGCGLGLPSLAAARRGAHVVASDWAPDALALLEQNARVNGIALRTSLLRWDAPGQVPGRQFDLVLAADLLYEERNSGPLQELLPLVVSPSGAAIVADPGRRPAAAWLRHATHTWVVERSPEPLLPRGGIYTLRRADSQRVDD